jgi:membrane dipeptidase
MQIADLHCDLLSFLAEDPLRSSDMPESRASYAQMKKGGVTIQVLAIFTKNIRGSTASAKRQLQALKHLVEKKRGQYQLYSEERTFFSPDHPIYVLPSFENGSGFAEEDSPIKEGLQFLESVIQECKKIFSISLTWDGENRFGGGSFSKGGLKDDGKKVLDWMDGKDIALDLSHASDYLAEGIINHLDKHSLRVPILASHSNARAITPKERNLPDFLIQEIIQRKGLIGLNFFAPFIGKDPEALALHVEHFLSLGGENSLCFGADFFYEPDLSYLATKYQTKTDFFPNLSNSSCYPFAIDLLQKNMLLSQEQLEKLCYKNMQNFLTIKDLPVF